MAIDSNELYVAEEINGNEFPDYEGINLEVFAPQWYLTKDQKDEYKIAIIRSKTIDKSPYFFEKVQNMLKALQEKNKIDNIDFITIVPKSDFRYSPTLNSIAKQLSQQSNFKYKMMLRRIIKGRRNVGRGDKETRYKQTRESMELMEPLNLNEKNILLLDDLKVTGITILESAKLLIEKGANKIYPICLGISWNEEYHNKIKDLYIREVPNG